MREFYSDPKAPDDLLGPPCPKCGIAMMLTRIEPEKPGEEQWTYECALCEESASQLHSTQPKPPT